MTVNMCVDAVHALEDLADQRRERLGERDACGVGQLDMIRALSGAVTIPILLGSTDSLSMLDWTQVISCSMYAGAAILVGRL